MMLPLPGGSLKEIFTCLSLFSYLLLHDTNMTVMTDKKNIVGRLILVTENGVFIQFQAWPDR